MGCVAKGFFLDYRHLVEYILYVQSIPPTQRDPLMQLWYRTRHYRWGPVFRLIKAAKAMGVHVEDPFVLVFNGSAFSTDGHLPFLKHSIRNSYRQLLLQRSVHRRIDCAGPTTEVDIPLTRKYVLSLTQPLHKLMVRYFLTGALDHNQRLFKANLSPTPICPHCEQAEETAHHIFLGVLFMAFRAYSLRYTYETL